VAGEGEGRGEGGADRAANGEAAGPRLDELPVHPGLCAACRHLRLLRSPRSTFARCALAEVDPRFPRYPRLPVVACAGYSPRGGGREPPAVD
jgi:hypothetical protein